MTQDVQPADPRRSVPRTDTLLADPRVAAAVERLGSGVVRPAVTAAQNRVRAGDLAPDAVVEAVVAALPAHATTLRPVLNATGVVLHTNLGRAPLSPAAVEAMVAAGGTVDVELDLATGRRGRRAPGVLAALLELVPQAEAALVVNNGAAALVLATTALAAGGEVVVSRGEMVEIGDGFRLHELVASTGVRVHEVGTTNRTHLRDYADAVGPATGAILKVHPSNFTVDGFTGEVGIRDLAGLGVPVVHDLGSGLLHPHPLLPHEPDATTSLRDGAARGDVQRRQAARRPAGRHRARAGRRRRAAAPAPARPGTAPREDDARGPRGDPARAATTRARRRRGRVRRPAAPLSGDDGGSRGCRRRRRGRAVARGGSVVGRPPGSCSPAGPCRSPSTSPTRCGRATRRCSPGSTTAAPSSTRERWRRARMPR